MRGTASEPPLRPSPVGSHMEPENREQPCHRPKAFDKMEALVKQMQSSEPTGVPVKSQKSFLMSIPAAFIGYDLIEWLMMRLGIEESEALNIANQLCQFGYFFPVSDYKNMVVRDDSSLYRFQSPYYWPWRNKPPDNVDYAIYLTKRTLRNKQRHGLEEYEMEAFSNLKRNLSNKWDIIVAQAEEQVKHHKAMKKHDKRISDSQEKAYWRVHRPPPGVPGSLEQVPVPTRSWNGVKPRKKTIDDWRREVELLRGSLYRTRIKVSQALEGLLQHIDTYTEYDPLLVPPQPANPWVNEDATFWQLNAPTVDVPTEKRVKKWALSMEDLLSDPTGVQEFTNYLQKEKSEENILFWLAVNDLRRSSQSQVLWKVQEIYENYVKHGSPREVNIDNQTMDQVLEGMKNNSRFCFDAAQEHVYNLLLKKDCYPRFIRSEYYKHLLMNGVQPLQKKRFFGFGPTKKKASTGSQPNQTQQHTGIAPAPGNLSKRRGSDRSLSGSAHEISHFGVGGGIIHTATTKDTKVSHSHSQSNLSDIPYRGDLDGNKTSPIDTTVAVKKPNIVPGTSTSEEVCPWETPATPPPRTPTRGRRKSGRVESESSSSDISVGITDVGEKVQRGLLTQQHTLDCGKKLHVDSYDIPRRASVSVPISHTNTLESSARRKVSSFEDNSASNTETTSPTFVVPENTTNDHYCSDGLEVPSNISADNNEKGKSVVKTCSTTTATTTTTVNPIISVSSVPADVPLSFDVDLNFAKIDSNSSGDLKNACEGGNSDEPSSSQVVQDSPAVATNQEPKAPLAEPDSESPGSEVPPEPNREGKEKKKPSEGEDDEPKNDDVCPWEDEENCKVNTPFVKKYATLGYL